MKSRIVLLGPPASGKGTQAEMIKAKYQIPSASPGAILRQNEAKNTGQKRPEDGRLLPDETINALVSDWIQANENAFVLDGYPRSIGQARALDECLSSRDKALEAVLFLDADEATIRQRIQRRVACVGCGRTFALGFNIGPSETQCPSCGAALTKRGDDSLETLKVRMSEYKEKTSPLIAQYSERKLLYTLDATRSADAVFESISNILERS